MLGHILSIFCVGYVHAHLQSLDKYGPHCCVNRPSAFVRHSRLWCSDELMVSRGYT